MKYIVLLLLVLLVSCDKPYENIITDQCMRIQLAQQCMKDIPKPPNVTHYSDWDEVVGQCDDNAYYQAKRKREFVKPECQAQ